MSIEATRSSALLTVPEVAEFLKVSVQSVRRLQQRRKIPFIKVGGCVRFTRNDIDLYLDGRRVPPID
ncbi:MAG: helix-turn-helix domain-containing protein [Hyphomicrobiales bacterium]|nr:helix-turn-helix domain-containing protein [Hyphomicrobiales bacterium]